MILSNIEKHGKLSSHKILHRNNGLLGIKKKSFMKKNNMSLVLLTLLEKPPIHQHRQIMGFKEHTNIVKSQAHRAPKCIASPQRVILSAFITNSASGLLL